MANNPPTYPYNSIDPKLDQGPEVAPTPQPGLERYDEKHNDKYVAGGYPSSGTPHRSPHRTFPLSPILFGLLVCLVTAIIVGGAVGGGLGSALASCNNRNSKATASSTSLPSSSNTTTSTSSSSSSANLANYAPAAPSSVQALSWTCPSINGTTFSTVGFSQDFMLYCGLDYTSGTDAVKDLNGKQLYDIVSFVAYDFSNCIQACSAYNAAVFSWNQNGTACRGVSWKRSLSTAPYGNCALKDRVPVTTYVATEDADTLSAACIARCPT